MAARCLPRCSPTPFNRTGGENKIKKHVGQSKDREFTYQNITMGKTDSGKTNLLPTKNSEKQGQV